MFEVTVNSQRYHVRFSHTPHDMPVRATVCRIYAVEDTGLSPLPDKPVAQGSAVFGIKDAFVRNTGRKRSMARALKQANFEKGDRHAFWDAYFEKRGRV